MCSGVLYGYLEAMWVQILGYEGSQGVRRGGGYLTGLQTKYFSSLLTRENLDDREGQPAYTYSSQFL